MLLTDSQTGQCEWLYPYLTETRDFPIPGILFRWYAKLLQHPEVFKKVIHSFAARYQRQSLDKIAALDARGFIFGAALAYELAMPLITIRKAGKLPGNVMSVTYDLEYGKNSLQVEQGVIKPHERVLIIDDILATGGTVLAACQLVEKFSAEVLEIACVLELVELQARKKLNAPVFSLLALT